MAMALVFPGQGSQVVGMGQDLAESFPVAKAVFDEVDEALGQSLSKLMWEGPAEELILTRNTQPALMAHSMAVLRVLQDEAGLQVTDMAFVAGHSLGEYSALCAAEAIGLAQTARLLRSRGEVMQASVPVGEGAMAALLGLTLDQVGDVLASLSGTDVCEIANDNAPGQVVISGTKAAIEQAIVAAKAAGAKRALSLPVSAPFHCSLMAPAAARMAEVLARTEVARPCVPVMANVTAAPVEAPEQIKRLLVEQVAGRVRWTESITAMAEVGVTQFVEIGAGKVLAGLVKRIAKGTEAISIGTVASIAKFKDFA